MENGKGMVHRFRKVSSTPATITPLGESVGPAERASLMRDINSIHSVPRASCSFCLPFERSRRPCTWMLSPLSIKVPMDRRYYKITDAFDSSVVPVRKSLINGVALHARLASIEAFRTTNQEERSRTRSVVTIARKEIRFSKWSFYKYTSA
jgi:hypothetical protein